MYIGRTGVTGLESQLRSRGITNLKTVWMAAEIHSQSGKHSETLPHNERQINLARADCRSQRDSMQEALGSAPRTIK